MTEREAWRVTHRACVTQARITEDFGRFASCQSFENLDPSSQARLTQLWNTWRGREVSIFLVPRTSENVPLHFRCQAAYFWDMTAETAMAVGGENGKRALELGIALVFCEHHLDVD